MQLPRSRVSMTVVTNYHAHVFLKGLGWRVLRLQKYTFSVVFKCDHLHQDEQSCTDRDDCVAMSLWTVYAPGAQSHRAGSIH